MDFMGENGAKILEGSNGEWVKKVDEFGTYVGVRGERTSPSLLEMPLEVSSLYLSSLIGSRLAIWVPVIQ